MKYSTFSTLLALLICGITYAQKHEWQIAYNKLPGIFCEINGVGIIIDDSLINVSKQSFDEISVRSKFNFPTWPLLSFFDAREVKEKKIGVQVLDNTQFHIRNLLENIQTVILKVRVKTNISMKAVVQACAVHLC